MSRIVKSLAPQDIYTSTVDNQFELGGFGETDDGRKFVYVQQNASAASVAGSLYQSQAESAANWEAIAMATAAVGAKTVVSTGTVTLLVNALAGGYMTVSTGTGKGYTYKIAGNTAATGAVVTIYLEDALQVALATGSTYVDVVPSPFKSVELWDYSNHDGMPVGVAVSVIPVSYYGWMQVKGPAGLLIDSSGVAVGVNVYASAAVDGCGDATSTYGFVGTAITAGSSTEVAMVSLNIL